MISEVISDGDMLIPHELGPPCMSPNDGAIKVETTDWVHSISSQEWTQGMLRSFARHQGVTCGAGACSGGGCSTVSVELIVAAVSTLSRRANSFCTTTKNTGTMIKASTTTAIMPPITPVPRACWLWELAPDAITMGATPNTNAKPVMRIGRKRRYEAAIAASISGLPWAR